MKELLCYIKRLDLKGLMLSETENTVIQLFRYCFVGGIAFLADWLSVILFTELGAHYMLSAAIAFVIGLIVNFFLSKRFIFKKDAKKFGRRGEFIAYAVIGVIGLALTEGIMFLLTDILALHYALSKIIAAAVVLIWNFFARKIFIY